MVKPGQIEFEEVDRPDISANQVLIKMRRIGICGSDLHVYHGMHPLTKYPVTQGHEVSGIIEDIGENISTFGTGDIVTVRPQITCGTCIYCKAGNYHICENLKVMGFQTTGMASEYVVVDKSKVLKISQKISIDASALVEPIAVACSAVEKAGDVKGKDILILGAGPIGILTGQVAKAKGAHSVMISDVVDYRLGIAKEVGLDYIVNPEIENLGKAIIQVYGKGGVNLVIECVGKQQTVNDAITYARKGSIIVLVGVFAKQPRVDFSTVQDHELTIKGLLMYRHHHFEEAISLLENELIQTQPLLSKHFPFEQYDDAYQYLINNKDKALKILIDIS